MAYTPEQERKLVILGSNSTEPVGFGGAAGIRISPGERFVLASNRNADSISVFQIRENGWLRLDIMRLCLVGVRGIFSLHQMENGSL